LILQQYQCLINAAALTSPSSYLEATFIQPRLSRSQTTGINNEGMDGETVDEALTSSHGTTPYKVSGLASGIDAETASWIQSNSGSGSNDYPFLVYKSPDAVLDGGTIIGQIDQTSEWRTVYNDTCRDNPALA
jgi:hypothetical protein